MKKVFFLINKYEYLISHKLDLIDNISSEYRSYVLCPGLKKKIIRKNKIILIDFNFSRKLKIYNDIIIFFKLIFIFFKKQPDIVHSFTIKLILYSSIISLFYKSKFIMNFSGLGNVFNIKKLKFRLFKLFTILTLKVFDSNNLFYLFQTKHDLNVIYNFIKFDENRSIIIPGSGVDINKYIKRENQVFKDDKLTIMLASRMLLNKGVRDFFEVSKSFVNQQINFLVVGGIDEGNDESLSTKELELMNSQTNVKWIGYKKNLFKYYNSVNIFCLPSYYGEGIPKVLLEAGSMSLPIIASNIPGCNEVVINNFNGYLFEPKNLEDLKEKIELIIDDKDSLKKFGENSRLHVSKNYSLHQITKQTLDFYKIIINQIA